MIKLREKDLEKLSDILQIPYAAIEKMSVMNLINDGLAIDLLIIHDWKTLKRSNIRQTQARIFMLAMRKADLQKRICPQRRALRYVYFANYKTVNPSIH